MSRITGIVRSAEVDYFGEKLNITYKPSEMTPQRDAEFAKLRKEAEESDEQGDFGAIATAAEQMAGRLAAILVTWDVMNNGEPMPPTKENLMAFPYALQIHIYSAINEDMRPKAKTGKRS